MTTESVQQRVERAAKSREFKRLSIEYWAYYADEAQRWYVVDRDAIAQLADAIDENDGNASVGYSRWCADIADDAQEMPAGWTPPPYDAEWTP